MSKSKERHNELMLKYLEDKSIFREDQKDQSQINTEKVHNWVKKMGKKRTAIDRRGGMDFRCKIITSKSICKYKNS